MSEKIEKAIAHITKEMMKNQNNLTIVRIEEHLTNLCTNDNIAEKLLKDDKSLKGAVDAMMKKARNRTTGSCACLTDEEGFSIVEEYYGITDTDKTFSKKTFEHIDVLADI